jgi:hypothetical protein
VTETGADIGTPHPDEPGETDIFTGGDPDSDVGEPDNLGADIGLPGDPSGS